jgi:hypothetical protein
MKTAISTRLVHFAAALAMLSSATTAVRASTYQTLVLSLNPMAYYPFNETGGATNAADISGNGHDAIIWNASADITLGAPGPDITNFPGLGGATAFNFDGGTNLDSDFVQCSVAIVTNWDIVNPTNGALSIVAWINTVGYGINPYQAIADKADANWRVENVNSSQIGYAINYDNSVSASGMTDGKWHLMVATDDGTNLYIYRDGRLAASPGGNDGAYDFSNNADIYIGANSSSPGRNWDGDITEVAFFDYALSPAQILQLWSVAQGNAGPAILTPPISESVLVGQPASFTVAAAAGTPPYTYQWYEGAAQLTGATNSTYSVASAGLTNDGTYIVVITDDASLSVTSQPVTLTVLTPVGAAGYESLVMSMGPVVYYPFDETSGTNATDIAGGHNGFFVNSSSNVTPGGATGPAGVAATAYAFGGSSGVDCFAPGYPIIAASNYWNFSFHYFTFAVWMQGAQSGGAPILMDQGRYGPPFFYCNQPNSGNVRFGFDNDIVNWNNGDQSVFSPGNVLDGNWHFVAGTFDSTAQLITLYVDGAPVATYATRAYPGGGIFDAGPNSYPPGWLGAYPLLIGGSPDGAGGPWLGAICHAAFFNRTLSATEISQLALAGVDAVPAPTITVQPASQTVLAGPSVTFSVVASPAGPVYAYQWQKNGVNISGGTARSYSIASVSGSDAGNYSVVVTGSGGTTNSQAASLAVVPVAAAGTLQDGLVLHLDFDDNYADSSGYGNDAHPTPWAPPPFVPGQIGQALQTVADANALLASCVTLGLNSPSLQFGASDDFSLSLWINYTNNNYPLPIIGNMAWGSSGFNDDNSGAGWDIVDDDGNLQYSFGSTGEIWSEGSAALGSVVFEVLPASPLNDGNWHHLVMTMDKTNYLVTTYVDGASIDTNANGSLSLTGLGSFIQSGDPTIGSDPGCTLFANSATAIYNIDDLAIWRRVLAPADVSSIYSLGTNGQSFAGGGIVGLSINQTTNGLLQISWPSGSLWSSGSVNGPWTQVTGATPPSYTVTPGGTANFYLVR